LLADLYQQFQDRTGYQIDSMHVTFFGLCPGCRKTKEQSRASTE
jgi:Fe2+ or Zn2+ uptake regulation protein